MSNESEDMTMADHEHKVARADAGATYSVEEDLLGETDRSYSQGALVRRRFFRHKAAMTALTILAIVIIVAWSSLGFGPIPGWWHAGYTELYPVQNGGAPTLAADRSLNYFSPHPASRRTSFPAPGRTDSHQL